MGLISPRSRNRRGRAQVVALGMALLGAVSTVAYVVRQRPRTADDPKYPGHEFRCECGQKFRATGTGRHRVFWLPDASPEDPVLDDTCPNCERSLITQE